MIVGRDTSLLDRHGSLPCLSWREVSRPTIMDTAFAGFPGLSRLGGIPHAEGVARERDGSEAEPHRNRGHGKTARVPEYSGEGREAPRDDGRREDNGEAGEQTGSRPSRRGLPPSVSGGKGQEEKTPEERFGPGGRLSHAADGMDARRRLAEEKMQNEGRRQVGREPGARSICVPSGRGPR